MKVIAFAFLFAAVSLNAELASTLPWLGGTMPRELIPHKEMDIRLVNHLQDGIPTWGMRFETGSQVASGWPLTMAFLEWDWQGDQGRFLLFGSRMETRIFQPIVDSIFAQVTLPMKLGSRGIGTVKGFSLGDWELSFNSAMTLQDGPSPKSDTIAAWEGHAGLRSPYLFWFTQTGLDAAWASGGIKQELTPQVFINLPGDISIQAGVTLSLAVPLWTFVLSYEIFPSP